MGKGNILVAFFNEAVFLKGKLNCESGYNKIYAIPPAIFTETENFA